MPPPPRPFRVVYRSFERITFDPAKSDEVFALRGFDLAYVAQIFPGYVLEREDTRDHPERRWQVIGEVLGEVFFVVYARPRPGTCRLITAPRPSSDGRACGNGGGACCAAWAAEPPERELWHDITR